MAQRVRKPYRGRNRPSSATQLPILAALHAGLPTLFAINIQEITENVKTQNGFFLKIFSGKDVCRRESANHAG